MKAGFSSGLSDQAAPFSEVMIPSDNRTFGDVLQGLSGQNFWVIQKIFENDEQGLRELLGEPSDSLEAILVRFGHFEARTLVDRFNDLIDPEKAGESCYMGEVQNFLRESSDPRRLASAVSGRDVSDDVAPLRRGWGSLLDGFGMDAHRPPYIDRALAKAFEKAAAEHLSAPESEPLITLLDRAAKNFFAARDVVDFRAIGLEKIEGALRVFSQEFSRSSGGENWVTNLSLAGVLQFDSQEQPQRRVQTLTDILQVFVAVSGEENHVKDLVSSFPEVVDQLLSDHALRTCMLSEDSGAKNPRAVAIVLEAMLERSSPGRGRLSLLNSTMPEAFTFVGPEGVRSLRAEMGFDHLADLRKADDCVVNGVVKLETFTSDLELAASLVNRMLQLPSDRFEEMKDTYDGRPVAEFEIEAVHKTVDEMVNILRESRGNTANNLEGWRQTAPFQRLPSWYQNAIETEVKNERSTSTSVEIVLDRQLLADRMGLKAEQAAEEILVGLMEDGEILRFSKSRKGSEADLLGLDYCVWLPDGSHIYLDVKKSDTGAFYAEGERVAFGQKVHMHQSLGFMGRYEDPKILFRMSELVVINPDSRYEVNKARMAEALSRATTLPEELRPCEVSEVLAAWQSPRDRRSR